MSNPIEEVPEANRKCPFCKTEGKVVRVLTYGANKTKKQIKLECPEEHHTWLYHTDD